MNGNSIARDRRRLAVRLAAWLGLVLGIGGATGRGDTVYDAALGFSVTENPAGPWSYGYLPAPGGDFIPYTDHGNNGGCCSGRTTSSWGPPASC